MKHLLLLLAALSILAGSSPVHAQPVQHTQKYVTGEGWTPFAPQFSKRAQIAPVISVAPVASGTNEVGETLTCTPGTWTGTTPLTRSYQWRRDAVNISGATNTTYVLVSDDAETDVDCVETAANKRGSGTADSNDIAIAAEGDGSLADVLASTVFDLDATQAASYPGSGTTWANLVTAPADGSAQTAYDFYTGNGSTSTTYPTFNGSAGSAAAYWSFDGGDRFDIKATTALLQKAHRTDVATPITFVMALNLSSSNFQYLFGHGAGTSANSYGFRFPNSTAGNELVSVFSRTNSTNTSYDVIPTDNVPVSTDAIIMISLNRAAGTGKWWVNSATGTSYTPSASASTADAEGIFQIGAFGGSSSLLSGAKLYSFAVLNETIDDTKAAAIIAALEARHGRDYTP